MPQKAEDYEVALPKDFQAPQGVEFVPNDKDPLLPQARAFALKHGLSKEGFSELLALHAAGEIGRRQSFADASSAEIGRLGVNGTGRVTAVNQYISTVPGVSAEQAQTFSKMLLTAAQVEVVEKIMAQVRNQGVGTISQAHREAPKADSPSDAEWNSMSYSARKEWAAKHDQAQLNGRGT